MSERYEILRLVGKGATGGVYHAHDTETGNDVYLRRFFSSNGNTDVSEWKETFEAITDALKTVKHRNLNEVLEAGIDEDGAYMTTPYTESKSAEKVFPSGMDTTELSLLAEQLLSALAEVHKHEMAHGGIDIQSIVVEKVNGVSEYRIKDLGMHHLAPLIQSKPVSEARPSNPAFLAPEIYKGGVTDSRSDLYMAGHLLYYYAAGAHPLGGLSDEEAQVKHLAHDYPSLSEVKSSIPQAWSDWIDKLTAPNPDDRPQSVEEALASIPSAKKSLVVTPKLKTQSGLALPSAAVPATQQGGRAGLGAGSRPVVVVKKTGNGMLVTTLLTAVVAIGVGAYFLTQKKDKEEDVIAQTEELKAPQKEVSAAAAQLPKKEEPVAAKPNAPAVVAAPKEPEVIKIPVTPVAPEVAAQPGLLREYRFPVESYRAYSGTTTVKTKSAIEFLVTPSIVGQERLLVSVEKVGAFDPLNSAKLSASPFLIAKETGYEPNLVQGMRPGDGWKIRVDMSRVKFKNNNGAILCKAYFVLKSQTVTVTGGKQIKQYTNNQGMTGHVVEMLLRNTGSGDGDMNAELLLQVGTAGFNPAGMFSLHAVTIDAVR